MLERLTDTFNGLFRKLSGNDKISEKNVSDAMSEVRTSLLEADVHVEVVDAFCERVLKDAHGKEVTKSLKPGQEMIGIVYDRLVEVLGGVVEAPSYGAIPGGPIINLPSPIGKAPSGPTVVMMCGLQGSGKTTTCGKLAAYLKKRGRSSMLAALDLQRPAAVEQLETLTRQVGEMGDASIKVLFYGEKDKAAEYGKAVGVAVEVAKRAYKAAADAGVDVLILDTAGRLHVNDELMGELTNVKRAVPPTHVFLVVDAMTGHDAVNSAKVFHQKLAVDGIILTKFDSDTRGGAAISVKHVTGATIKFVGVGEKLDALDEFHAQRFAGRILGMGDVLSLVEKAQEQVSQADADKLHEKMARGEMSMDDFLKQLKTLRRMGPLKQLLGMLPGVGGMLKDVHIEDKQLDKVEAMINSMNRQERDKPAKIDIPRRRRIAGGSGTRPDDISQLVKQFDMVGKMTRQMASLSAGDRVKAVKDMGGGAGLGAMVPGLKGMPGMRTHGSTAMPSIKARFKKRK